MPSMAASLSAQGFSHTHAYCPLCMSFPGDQPSPDTPPCPARTPDDKRKGGQSTPKGSDGKHLDRDGTYFSPLTFPMTSIYR